LCVYTRWNLGFVSVRFQASTRPGRDNVNRSRSSRSRRDARPARVIRARSCSRCVYRVRVITRGADLLNRLIVTARTSRTPTRSYRWY